MSMSRLCLAAACVLATPALAGVTTEGDFRIEYQGKDIGGYSNLDDAVKSWMTSQNIHAAQLAVRKSGTLIFSHAYTMGAKHALVKTSNVFRLASISKMLETAAFSQLLGQGKLTGNEHVYSYLGITAPLLPGQTADKRARKITSMELEQHTSGLPGEGEGDPLFEMRDIEVSLGAAPLTEPQFAQYLYGLPLLSDPGTTALYSNVGYFLLGMVIEKATHDSFLTYVQNKLLKPLGLHNWTLSPTSEVAKDPNEVGADDPYTGPSVFDISGSAPQKPFDYEGGDIIWEVAAPPSDFVTNAESVSKFIGTWNVYGLGGRAIDYARSGCIPGAATWAESETSDIDFSLLFNRQPCLGFDSGVIGQIRSILSVM